MKAVRLAFLVQLPAFRVAFALLDLSCRGRIIVILLIEGLLAQFLSILLVGLDVGQVRIQNGSLYQAFFYSLAQNLIKATPHNVVLIK